MLSLPSLQFYVGSDYHTYTEIFNNPVRLDLYQRKGEYLFYYLVILLNSLNLDSQSLFFSIGLIQTILLLNILRLISNYDFEKITVLIFLVFIVTNMMNNQLNVLRSFVAIFSFINAYMYMQMRKKLISFAFFLFGFYWHSSMLLTLPFLLLNEKLHKKIISNALLIYLLSLLIYSSGIIDIILTHVVSIFLPSFDRYVENRAGTITITNLLTKLYYIPVHIIFFVKLYRSFNFFTKIEKSLLSIWPCVDTFDRLFDRLSVAKEFNKELKRLGKFEYRVSILLLLYRLTKLSPWETFNFLNVVYENKLK